MPGAADGLHRRAGRSRRGRRAWTCAARRRERARPTCSTRSTSSRRCNAVVLSGGSAFGLDAATGVMRYLEEHGVGFETGGRQGADRAGRRAVRPERRRPEDPAERRLRLPGGRRPPRPVPIAEGNVGAGSGATVGKLAGAARAMRGGLGTASITTPDGLVVAGHRRGQRGRRHHRSRDGTGRRRACGRPTGGAWPTRGTLMRTGALAPAGHGRAQHDDRRGGDQRRR